MITLSNRLKQLMTQNPLTLYTLLRIDDSYMTDSPYDLTIGADTYLSSPGVVLLSPPSMDTVVDRETYTIEIADPEFAFGPTFFNSMTGKTVEVKLVFLDNTTDTVDLTETFLVYKGQIDSTNFSIETDVIGSVRAQILGSSPMADLDATRPFYTSKEFIRDLDATDTAFDQIYEGAGVVNLRWGKV